MQVSGWRGASYVCVNNSMLLLLLVLLLLLLPQCMAEVRRLEDMRTQQMVDLVNAKCAGEQCRGLPPGGGGQCRGPPPGGVGGPLSTRGRAPVANMTPGLLPT